MSSENEAMRAHVAVTKNLADSCERTCSMDEIDERMLAMAGHVALNYAMNRAENPFAFKDMETTVEIEATATCPGGRRKLFGGFTCAVETSCRLTAESVRPNIES